MGTQGQGFKEALLKGAAPMTGRLEGSLAPSTEPSTLSAGHTNTNVSADKAETWSGLRKQREQGWAEGTHVLPEEPEGVWAGLAVDDLEGGGRRDQGSYVGRCPHADLAHIRGAPTVWQALGTP